MDLVFGAQWGFISKSAYARLQLSMQRLQIVPPWLTQNWISTFWPVTSKSRSNHGWQSWFLLPRQIHMWRKFGDRRSVRMHMWVFFCNDLKHTTVGQAAVRVFAYNITGLCAQQSQFVARWLTDTQTVFNQLIW